MSYKELYKNITYFKLPTYPKMYMTISSENIPKADAFLKFSKTLYSKEKSMLNNDLSILEIKTKKLYYSEEVKNIYSNSNINANLAVDEFKLCDIAQFLELDIKQSSFSHTGIYEKPVVLNFIKGITTHPCLLQSVGNDSLLITPLTNTPFNNIDFEKVNDVNLYFEAHAQFLYKHSFLVPKYLVKNYKMHGNCDTHLINNAVSVVSRNKIHTESSLYINHGLLMNDIDVLTSAEHKLDHGSKNINLDDVFFFKD